MILGDVPTIVIGPGVRTGVPILTDNPREVGPDRIVNTLAAHTLYGGPAVVVDFGTSTNVDAIGPDFVNAVAALETTLAAPALLTHLQRIEAQHGRERSGRNAPRTLDLDLLLYGAEVIDEDGLIVPHARLHERAFVLVPLLEIAPDVVIPRRGRAADLLPGVASQAVARVC